MQLVEDISDMFSKEKVSLLLPMSDIVSTVSPSSSHPGTQPCNNNLLVLCVKEKVVCVAYLCPTRWLALCFDLSASSNKGVELTSSDSWYCRIIKSYKIGE